MEKIIYLDFDGVVVNSIKAFCDVYNNVFKEEEKFVPADWTKVNRWDLADECPLTVDIVEGVFKSDDFFEVLEFMDEDTLNIINKLKEKYKIIICSIGTPENISKKTMWIKDNLGIEDMILLSQSEALMDKSIIDMSDGIIIDDHGNNLITSNAGVKICFGEIKEWNEDWEGIMIANWKELGEMLL